MFYLKSFLTSLLLTISISSLAQEKCSVVKEIGYCWSGHQAAVAQMENGDQMYLGEIDDERTKLFISLALTSKATNEQICYKIFETRSWCSIDRHRPEWWVLGGKLSQ